MKLKLNAGNLACNAEVGHQRESADRAARELLPARNAYPLLRVWEPPVSDLPGARDPAAFLHALQVLNCSDNALPKGWKPPALYRKARLPVR